MRAAPYFLTNEAWYSEETNSNGEIIYKLTNEAPKEAIESYNDYYSEPVFTDDDGNVLDFSGYSCDC